ncbi:MAG: DUF192 domain-containing protein [Polymorphobacter sp.]
MKWLVALAVAAAPIAAAAAAPTLAGTAQTGLATTTLTLVTQAGNGPVRHRYTVEVAQTPQQQATGMMYRRTLPQGHGMIFPFASPRTLTFWMEDTLIPLDLVFIGADWKVVSIAADAKPLSRDFISSAGPAIAVLELGGGEAARIGLQPGDRVETRLPK